MPISGARHQQRAAPSCADGVWTIKMAGPIDPKCWKTAPVIRALGRNPLTDCPTRDFQDSRLVDHGQS